MVESKRGFKIFLDHARNIVKIQIWGFWDVDLAEKFEREFQKKVKDVNASEQEWHLLIDLTANPPQSQEVQDIIRRGLTFLKDQKLRRRAILANTPIPLFQMSWNTHPPIYAYFQTEDDAIRWLLNKYTNRSDGPG